MSIAQRYNDHLTQATNVLAWEFHRPDFIPGISDAFAWLACTVAEELAYEMLEADAKRQYQEERDARRGGSEH